MIWSFFRWSCLASYVECLFMTAVMYVQSVILSYITLNAFSTCTSCHLCHIDHKVPSLHVQQYKTQIHILCESQLFCLAMFCRREHELWVESVHSCDHSSISDRWCSSHSRCDTTHNAAETTNWQWTLVLIFVFLCSMYTVFAAYIRYFNYRNNSQVCEFYHNLAS